MSNSEQKIVVEVAYALPNKQKIVELEVPSGTTAMDAVKISGIEKFFLEIDIQTAVMGIFSQTLGGKGVPAAGDYILNAGDRVEIYRPLIADPKQVRKERAEKAKKERQEKS